MSNDLLGPDDLSGYPGAPFTEEVVDAAVAALRAAAGWHIAPSRTETVTLDSDGSTILMLPTLHLTDVSAVSNVYSDPATELTGWRKSRAGMLSRPGGWPRGFEAVEVTMTHGFAKCPAELLPLAASVAYAMKRDAAVVQESAGSMAVTYRDGSTTLSNGDALSGSAALARYRINGRP